MRESYHGYTIKHQGPGLYPQLAGWYGCHADDDKHEHCIGPMDSKDEVYEVIRVRVAKDTRPEDEHDAG